MANTNINMRGTFMTSGEKQRFNNLMQALQPNRLMIKAGCILCSWVTTFNNNRERRLENMTQHLLIQPTCLPKWEKNRITISNHAA